MIIELTSRGRPAAAQHKTARTLIEKWASEGYGYEDIAVRLRASRLPVDLSTIKHIVMDREKTP